MFGRVPDQRIDALDCPRKIFLVRQLVAALGIARRFTVVVVQINEVDVAGHIEFACPELAHADHPQLRDLARLVRFTIRRAVEGFEFRQRRAAGDFERKLGQFGHGGNDVGKRCAFIAIEDREAFHYQLTHRAQRISDVVAACLQYLEGNLHRCARGCALWQQDQVGSVAASQALNETRVRRQR